MADMFAVYPSMVCVMAGALFCDPSEVDLLDDLIRPSTSDAAGSLPETWPTWELYCQTRGAAKQLLSSGCPAELWGSDLRPRAWVSPRAR